MATYKDDLDILKAAEKDANKLSLNAITELDNKGLLGMYGGGGSEIKTGAVQLVNSDSAALQIGFVRFLDGILYPDVEEFSSKVVGLDLNDVFFPSVIVLNDTNYIFQESASREIVVTEEVMLHIVFNGGGK